jgi:hypothetical protein
VAWAIGEPASDPSTFDTTQFSAFVFDPAASAAHGQDARRRDLEARRPADGVGRPKQDDQRLRRQLPLPGAGAAHARKSTGGGFTDVATVTLTVPVGKATEYKFSYLFTADDGAIGKVSFRATATIVGARDALPADNSITALATRVK